MSLLLFPIQYHEVVLPLDHLLLEAYDCQRFGKCTRRLKPRLDDRGDGPFPRTFTIGTTA